MEVIIGNTGRRESRRGNDRENKANLCLGKRKMETGKYRSTRKKENIKER